MRAINVLLSILVSLAIGLLVFEGGLRLIGMGPKTTLNQFDADTGWSKKPNNEWSRRGREFGQIEFEINALGLRDDPMADFSKPEGSFRIVMLGDSFTLGYTVNREHLFVDQLEQHWNAEGRQVEVLNVATEGWSTDQEVAWLIAHGEELQPDLVVLFPYDNDIFYCGQSSYANFPKPRFDFTGRLEQGELIDPTGDWRLRTAVGRLISKTPQPPTFTTSGGKTLPGDFAVLLGKAPAILGDALERTRGALTALRIACHNLGSDLVVAPIPSNASVDAEFARAFGQIVMGLNSSEWAADRAYDFFLRTSEALEIATLDARESMRQAHKKQACYLDFFGPDREWHFNPNGNRAFAEFLDSGLADRLPAGNGTSAPAFAVASVENREASGIPGWLKLYCLLWIALTALYFGNYRDEAFFLPPLKVGLLLAVVFSTFMLVSWGVEEISIWKPQVAGFVLPLLITGVLGFVAYKLGNRLATIVELIKAFTLRGHWYLMPLVVVLLTIGSLLVVAASSPLIAPFIYTLF